MLAARWQLSMLELLKKIFSMFKDIPNIYRQMPAGRNASCNAAEVAKRKPGFLNRTLLLPVLSFVPLLVIMALIHNNAGILSTCHRAFAVCLMSMVGYL